MDRNDHTKQILQGILADLYQQQAGGGIGGGCYLIAQDKQFLGAVTMDSYDQNSLLNKYGPYGSVYSPTSVFNQYSQYGSQFGVMSLNNPYSSMPPKLFIKGKFFGYVTKNNYLNPKIDPAVFFYNLENNIEGLMRGDIVKNKSQLRQKNSQSFLEAADGTFLGSLVPNVYDTESVFNKFGTYGSEYSLTSIFNKFGTYGSEYSNLSPYNIFTNQPPKVYINGKHVAYLSKNQFINPKVDPDNLYTWAKQNVNQF